MPPSSSDILETMFDGRLDPIGYLQYVYTPPLVNYPSDFMLFKVSDGEAQSGVAFVTINLDGGTSGVL